MWFSYYICLCVLVHQSVSGLGADSKRQKRYLLFTPSTQWGVFATVSVPLHPDSTTSVAWFFEANYYNVANATYFEPLLGDIEVISRGERSTDQKGKKRLLTRSSFYTFVETMLERHGYPGRSCFLHAICENALSDFVHSGVLGDLLHFLLTPSATMTEDDLEDCYYEAEYLGLEDQCHSYERDCPYSPFELINIYFEYLT